MKRCNDLQMAVTGRSQAFDLPRSKAEAEAETQTAIGVGRVEVIAVTAGREEERQGQACSYKDKPVVMYCYHGGDCYCSYYL